MIGEKRRSPFKSVEEARETAIRRDPQFARAWERSATKRRLALALIKLRRHAHLTQAALGEIAGWDKAQVSRLESASDSIPDTATIARYCSACSAAAGLVMLTQREDGALDVTIIPIASDNAASNSMFDTLAKVMNEALPDRDGLHSAVMMSEEAEQA